MMDEYMGIGSVKSAISSYRERILEGKASTKKSQESYAKKAITKKGEHLSESRRLAESHTEAETQLSAAKGRVNDLRFQIEESNSRTKASVQELEKMNPVERRDEEELPVGSPYAQVMRELEAIKREVSKLKLDMASVLEEKKRAEKEKGETLSKMRFYASLMDELNDKIEAMDEEHVLVELARIEAVKEFEEVEAWRRENDRKCAAAKNGMVREIEEANGLETELAAAVAEIRILESEIMKYKDDRRLVESEKSDLQDEESLSLVNELESVRKEVEATKMGLILIKEESFQLMASMDIIREERKIVAEETAFWKKKEEKADMVIQDLNSKLLRAKVKLEAASAAEETAKSTVTNLLLKLGEMKPETETAKKELAQIQNEAAIAKEQVQRTETEIALAEERFYVLMQELKAAKESESVALENLKEFTETTLGSRASSSHTRSTLTISKLEYEYLTGHAAGAKEIARKKIAAAKAWVEALNASEREILIKMEQLTREKRMKEASEIQETEQLLIENDVIADEIENWRQNIRSKKLRSEISLPSRAVNRSVVVRRAPSLPSRATNRSVRIAVGKRGKGRGSSSPVFLPTPRSTPFVVRKKRKVLPTLVKLFRKNIESRNV